jgi:predicted metal-dependent enzyme (double-stranded beta helix superfamily)
LYSFVPMSTEMAAAEPSRPLDLSRPQLRSLVEELAAEAARWQALVRHDPAQRVFECLLDEPAVEAWLICWMPGHDTGFHDHDLSSGAVTVVDGSVCEERLRIGGGVSSAVYGPGEVFDFTSSDIHRVTHAGAAPAITLHAYSPRLRRMGAYAISRDGALQRHPLAYGAELLPLEPA